MGLKKGTLSCSTATGSPNITERGSGDFFKTSFRALVIRGIQVSSSTSWHCAEAARDCKTDTNEEAMMSRIQFGTRPELGPASGIGRIRDLFNINLTSTNLNQGKKTRKNKKNGIFPFRIDQVQTACLQRERRRSRVHLRRWVI